MHRPIAGEIKTCTIKKTPSGEWDVCLSCEVNAEPLPSQSAAVGIDAGLESFATLSDGQKIENPRFFRKGEKRLAKERQKAARVAAKTHERIKNQRKDFCHKETKKIIDQYQYICIEDLDIKNMIEGSPFAKSIADASWNQFRQFLTYKAEEAGRKLGLVNPAYTSQTCSQCGHLKSKKLADRMHRCSRCGYTANRDFNAAQNILALGLDGLGAIPRSLRL